MEENVIHINDGIMVNIDENSQNGVYAKKNCLKSFYI